VLACPQGITPIYCLHVLKASLPCTACMSSRRHSHVLLACPQGITPMCCLHVLKASLPCTACMTSRHHPHVLLACPQGVTPMCCPHVLKASLPCTACMSSRRHSHVLPACPQGVTPMCRPRASLCTRGGHVFAARELHACPYGRALRPLADVQARASLPHPPSPQGARPRRSTRHSQAKRPPRWLSAPRHWSLVLSRTRYSGEAAGCLLVPCVWCVSVSAKRVVRVIRGGLPRYGGWKFQRRCDGEGGEGGVPEGGGRG